MVQFDPNEYDPTADNNSEPIEEGEYPFCVIGAEEATSKAGNPMLELRFDFDVGRESSITVYDRLVFVSTALWKVHQFCAATGLVDAFNGGELTQYDVQGVSGMARLVLGEKNSKGMQYMKVKEYLPPAGYSEQPAGAAPRPQAAVVAPQGVPEPAIPGFPEPYPAAEEPPSGDDIPF